MSPLIPFVLGRADSAARLAERCPVDDCVPLDVFSARAEFSLLLAGNADSYGGLAMPAWVLLDCAALPAGVIGFARDRADVDGALYARLVERTRVLLGSEAAAVVEKHQGLVPVAEYACVPTPEPGHVVGFSLFSLERGLGVRTKAMALVMHRARRQTGVAQVGGRALRAHAMLGALDVVKAGVPVHEKAATTIAYELMIDDRDRLLGLARGIHGARPSHKGAEPLPIDDKTIDRLEEMRVRGRVSIVDADEHKLMVLAAPSNGSGASPPG